MTPTDTPRSRDSRISIVRHLLRAPRHGNEVLGWLIAWGMILLLVVGFAQWAAGPVAGAAVLIVAAIAVATGTIVDRLT